MQRAEVKYKSSIISYLVIGNGPTTLICFHGYGEEGGSFKFFERFSTKEYTTISVDLPFHGDTAWNDGLFEVDDLLNVLYSIMKNESRQLANLHLCGFSLGGRVALSLYEALPEKVRRITLLAPDGLKLNFWYWFATQTGIGRGLFSFTMRHPTWFFGFLSVLNKLKLVNSSVYKFVKHYVDDEEARKILLKRWIVLRKLRPNIGKIKNQIKEQQTLVNIIYGKHDRIILPARGEKFQKGIEQFCSISVIRSGHQVLHERHAEEILPILLR